MGLKPCARAVHSLLGRADSTRCAGVERRQRAADVDPPPREPSKEYKRLASLEGLRDRLSAITDMNQLQTALSVAIAAEDYGLAARVRDRMKEAGRVGLRRHVSVCVSRPVLHMAVDAPLRLLPRAPQKVEAFAPADSQLWCSCQHEGAASLAACEPIY